MEIKVPTYELPQETVSIGIPCWRSDIKPQFLESIIALCLSRIVPIVDCYIARNMSIAEARNEIVKKTKGDRILMCDADMTFTPQDIKMLYDADEDIIAPLFFQRSRPYKPLIFREENHPSIQGAVKLENILKYPAGKIDVDGVGTGIIMIKRSVFDRLESPWFVYQDPKIGLSEDLYFCKKARDAGFKIKVDTRAKTGHIGDFEVTEKEFLISYIEKYASQKKDRKNREKRH